MSKPYRLQRRIIPERINPVLVRFFSPDWRHIGRYATVEQAEQAYDGLMKSKQNWNCEYRIDTPVGIVTLPVVKG